MTFKDEVASLSSGEVLARMREVVRAGHAVEADVLVLLGEVDERKLFLERAYPSLFAFCVGELGFSEEAAYYRIHVARAARRLPAMLEAIRCGDVHLSGMRVLAPHLTEENQCELLARAARKTKRQIEEIVAALAPKPAVASAMRKLPERRDEAAQPAAGAAPAAAGNAPVAAAGGRGRDPPVLQLQRRAVIKPLAEQSFLVQFTATRAQRDKLFEARGLMRHRVPDGDLALIVERAIDLLIADVKKQRFGVGRKPRPQPARPGRTWSRHVPAALARAVFERDEGCCSFIGQDGRRCGSTDGVEIDHIRGFALTREHRLDDLRLVCRAHNQHLADRLYGREFMDCARREGARAARPGACSDAVAVAVLANELIAEATGPPVDTS